MSDPTSTPTASELATRAHAESLARAALYGALALGFRPPSRETAERLLAGEAGAALVTAAELLDSSYGVAAAIHALRAAGGDLESDHRRLFGHTVRGKVPPYETEYGEDDLFLQPQELGDLAGFAHAFGLTLRPDAHERIDHVSCECELLSFLACKEAYAIEHGDTEMREVTALAAARFLRDHLGRFAPSFAARLEREDGGGFYGCLGALLLAVVRFDCARLGVAMGNEELKLRLPVFGNIPIGCGSGSEVCRMPGAEEPGE